jgi:hypothetical protein
MQIDRDARAETQARDEAYARPLARQQRHDLAPISPAVSQGAVPGPMREQPAVACPYFVSPGVCGMRAQVATGVQPSRVTAADQGASSCVPGQPCACSGSRDTPTVCRPH